MEKKRVNGTVDSRGPQPKAAVRPVGMQAMGPALYAQIRLALLELGLAPATAR
jgi:hypothetical protein